MAVHPSRVALKVSAPLTHQDDRVERGSGDDEPESNDAGIRHIGCRDFLRRMRG